MFRFFLGYCTEQSDFYTNCQNLSPESELITIYRDNSLSEKCPLSGLYVLSQSNVNNHAQNSNDDRSYRSSSGYSSNNKCVDSTNQGSMIMECSDQSMLKLQFGKCMNMPSMLKIRFNTILNLIRNNYSNLSIYCKLYRPLDRRKYKLSNRKGISKSYSTSHL